MRSTSQGATGSPSGIGDLRQSDLELVDAFVAGFVDARGLTGRADEEAGEEIRERGMVVPVGDDAGQKVGASQKRAVGRCQAPHDDMIAAAGAGVAAIEHELLGRQPRKVRVLVEAFA